VTTLTKEDLPATRPDTRPGTQPGTQPGTRNVELAIDGMTCASCVRRVEKAILARPGVDAATVNLATERASIRYAPSATSVADLIQAVDGAGYHAAEFIEAGSGRDAEKDAELVRLRRALVIASVLAVPVVVLEMGSHFIPALHDWVMNVLGMQTSWIIQFVLTTAILAGPGRRFFVKGVPALLRGGPDMNSLVAIGTAAAWV
jgi:cation transport ATPase